MFSGFNSFSNAGDSSSIDEVLITRKEDFPDTLESGKSYIIDAAITFGNGEEIVIPENAYVTFKSTAPLNGVTYTGDNTLLTGTNIGGLYLESIDVTNTGNGTLLDITGAAGFPSISALNSSFVGFKDLGTIDNFYASASRCSFIQCGTGVNMVDCPLTVIRSSIYLLWNNDGAYYTRTSGTCSNVQFNDNICTPGSNDYILLLDSGMSTDGVMISGNLNNTQNRFFDPAGLDQGDPKVTCVSNSNQSNSITNAYITFHDNASETSITAINTPIRIKGTYTEKVAERVTTTSGGRMTYTGLEDTDLTVNASISPEIATGTKIPCAFYINHGNDTNNLISVFADAGGGQVTVTVANWTQHALANSDRVVIFGTSNYNGTYSITNVSIGGSTTTFDITATWVSDDATGVWSIIDEDSRVKVDLTNGETINVFVGHRECFNTDDFIEVFFENQSNTTNATMLDTSIIWAV